MATATTTTPTTTWSQPAVEDLVIELLATMLNQPEDELRQESLQKGSGMPVDSLDLMDILVEFRQRTGLTIPKRKLRRQTMRSVKAFSEFAAREARP